MVSYFRETVMPIVNAKKELKTYKPDEIVSRIGKDLDDGKIDLAGAMSQLKAALGYDLTDNDYRDIEKKVGYNVRK